ARAVPRLSSVPAQALDLAAFAHRGAARTPVAAGDRGAFLLGRGRESAVLDRLRRDGRPDALEQDLAHDDDPLPRFGCHAHLVTDAHGCRSLRALPVDPHVATAARCRALCARLDEAHRPDPAVDPRLGGSTYATSVGRAGGYGSSL